MNVLHRGHAWPFVRSYHESSGQTVTGFSGRPRLRVWNPLLSIEHGHGPFPVFVYFTLCGRNFLTPQISNFTTFLCNVLSYFRSIYCNKYIYICYETVICYINGSRKRILGFLRTISGYFCVYLCISLIEGDFYGFRVMGLCGMKCRLFVIVFLFIPTSFEASPFISDGIFGSHDSGERRLLQAKTHCPVSFEFQNYTIITSKCKGPEYPPDLCCSSFKEFACPFADSLNDSRNDCATIMFSYININGKYPAGLFASICREGRDGLECPEVTPPSMLSENANKNLSRNIRKLLPITMLIVASLALTLQYF